ncbi:MULTISPECIES: Tm-1-like ATP-binding domain-containing protein [Microvirga]|uniref:Tm-1-like ATP-binding domain-containing protein n=1 Tax=Microvirga TaxID=186650 RepID=UPI001CFE30FD|nr:Tm-1-like ATP-binding domain-containing protein [Microvirga lenta]MCB5174643.1 Tm-1-like ATP-binding domain-containing protein [Microvirga lenta]
MTTVPSKGKAYIVGTFDTKAEELRYVGALLRGAGIPTVLVDVGTKSSSADADVPAETVASHHPDGVDAVFRAGERGIAVDAMRDALQAFMRTCTDVGGIIGLGGSGGTAIITPTMQRLPIGMPKVMVSTLASGDISRFIGVSDIIMMFPVTDIAGLNRVSRVVLGNAAHALAGMMVRDIPETGDDKPSIGISMFGVTTPCVQQLTASLSGTFDCQVFHANGPGGRALEALTASGLFRGVVDVTTTEAADYLFGGVCSAGPDRFEAVARADVPWVGSCGALDMVNFWAMDTVPERYRGRLLHSHNAHVTLMRTSADEMVAIGEWLAGKLNRSRAPVRLLIPEGGLSMLDAPGQPFFDPAANEALFASLERSFQASETHRIVRVPHHINDPAFVEELVQHVHDVMGDRPSSG